MIGWSLIPSLVSSICWFGYGICGYDPSMKLSVKITCSIQVNILYVALIWHISLLETKLNTLKYFRKHYKQTNCATRRFTSYLTLPGILLNDQFLYISFFFKYLNV